MKTIFKDKNNGIDLLECELPKGFKTEAFNQIKQYKDDQKVYVEAHADKDNCHISYQTGETYFFEKKKVQMMTYVPEEPQNSSGAWRMKGVPTLTQDLDNVASKIAGKKLEAKDYFNLPESIMLEARERFNEDLQKTAEQSQLIASFYQVAVGTIIRGYLLDGGLGVYEDGDKIIATALIRSGMETDTVMQRGFVENITGEPFGQATDNPYASASNCYWDIHWIMSMVTENKDDIKIFMQFVETLKATESFKQQVIQFKQQLSQYQIQQIQIKASQDQAMWNMAFANQQQQFAAMDRLSNQLSRDMDEWRAGQNQMRQQMDSRITPSNTSFETSDDRIQRMRHESMMGVETYERNDGSTVEYSNMADRVFENNLDSTTHFGTHHYYDDYIPEGWHEMKKK